MTSNPLSSFAVELSERLEQFGIKKGPLEVDGDGPEKYCTVARLKIAGARSNVFAFEGPYLGGGPTLWAGFGSRSQEAIDLLQAATGRNIRFCSIGYDDWRVTFCRRQREA
jgi:hypothetical protein